MVTGTEQIFVKQTVEEQRLEFVRSRAAVQSVDGTVPEEHAVRSNYDLLV